MRHSTSNTAMFLFLLNFKLVIVWLTRNIIGRLSIPMTLPTRFHLTDIRQTSGKTVTRVRVTPIASMNFFRTLVFPFNYIDFGGQPIKYRQFPPESFLGCQSTLPAWARMLKAIFSITWCRFGCEQQGTAYHHPMIYNKATVVWISSISQLDSSLELVMFISELHF